MLRMPGGRILLHPLSRRLPQGVLEQRKGKIRALTNKMEWNEAILEK